MIPAKDEKHFNSILTVMLSLLKTSVFPFANGTSKELLFLTMGGGK